MTDKTVSDQVEKTTFEQQITRQCGRVVKVTVQHRQPGDPRFDSWKSKKIDFSKFEDHKETQSTIEFGIKGNS